MASRGNGFITWTRQHKPWSCTSKAVLVCHSMRALHNIDRDTTTTRWVPRYTLPAGRTGCPCCTSSKGVSPYASTKLALPIQVRASTGCLESEAKVQKMKTENLRWTCTLRHFLIAVLATVHVLISLSLSVGSALGAQTRIRILLTKVPPLSAACLATRHYVLPRPKLAVTFS